VRIEPLASATVRGAIEVKNAGWRDTYLPWLGAAYLDALDARLERAVAGWSAALADGSLFPTWVAVAGEAVVGVASEHRGSGIAAALLRAAIGDAPAFLWVLEENPRARGFYAKMGFVADGAVQALPAEWNGAREVRMVRR